MTHRTNWKQWSRRWLAGHWPEVILGAIAALLQIMMQPVSRTTFLLGLLLCLGAALSGFRLILGSTVAGLALLSYLAVPPTEIGPVIYAAIVPVLAGVSRRRYQVALVSTLVYLTQLVLITSQRVIGPTLLGYAMVWLVIFTIPWVMGMIISSTRIQERRSLEANLEQQRRQIAAELHDNVAHDLALIIMRVEQAQSSPDGNVAQDLAFIASTARRSTSHLRHLMGLLRVKGGPSVTISRLSDSLTESVRQLQALGFTVNLLEDGDVHTIPTAVGSVLAKVTKEATNNIAKHGDPSVPCSVIVHVEAGSVEMAFLNAMPARATRGVGIGQEGMHERIITIGGTFTAGPRGENQWLTRVSVPLRSDDPVVNRTQREGDPVLHAQADHQ